MTQTGTISEISGSNTVPELDFHAARKLLVLASAVVIALGIFREWFVATYGVETVFQDMRHIALDAEMCLPAWYSALLMVLAAFLLGVIARLARRHGEPFALHWAVLSAVFVAMSLDEATSVHELMLEPIQQTFNLTGPFFFAWVVPALVLVPLFALAYARFLLALPRPFGLGMLIAGAVYVGGALGMEMVGGVTYLAVGEHGLAYILSFIAEESLEIIGLTAFVIVLLAYLRARFRLNLVRF